MARTPFGIVTAVASLAALAGCRGCTKSESQEHSSAPGTAAAVSASAPGAATGTGLRAPIAAAHVDGSVIVVGVDADGKAIRAVQLDAKSGVTASRVVLDDVGPSPDSELKLHVHPADGAFFTWRGLRHGKLVRELVRLDASLAPKGEPASVPGASCATREAAWFTDGVRATSKGWANTASTIQLPKDADASLLCGASRAFAVLEHDDNTSVLALADGAKPIEVLREKDFGDDEARDTSEYTVGDDVGFVRVGDSGSVAFREVHDNAVQPLHKLKTSIPKDDEPETVDASSDMLVVIHTRDDSASCSSGDRNDAATKVLALRVRRDTLEESNVEIATGKCGTEIGPFFTGALGKSIAIAWPERARGAGKARAPIVALSHATLSATGTPKVERIEQAADVLVDAGCDGTHCYAVALTRPEGAEPTAPGTLKVLRY